MPRWLADGPVLQRRTRGIGGPLPLILARQTT
jgi:hypothetical protein